MVATAVAGLALAVPAAEAARLESDPLTVEVDAWGATNAHTAGVAPGAARTVRIALRARPRLVRVSVGAGGVLRRIAR